MGIAVTDSEICSQALSLLGQAPISTLNAASGKTGLVAGRWYDDTRRQVLSEHTWNFAKHREVVNRSGTPAFQYSDKYQLPADYLSLVDMYSSDGLSYITDFQVEFDIQGNELLLNAEGATTINLLYVKDEVNIGLYPAWVKQCLLFRLAANMAMDITQKASERERFVGLYIQELQRAKAKDGQEKPTRRVERSMFEQARYTLTNRNYKYGFEG